MNKIVRYGEILSVVAGLFVGDAFASVVTNGTEITFTVASGVTERYDFAIGTDITKLIKEGAGTMQMTKAGAKRESLVVSIKAGILELKERDALNCYNQIYVSSGAQLYQHSAYASGENYATICHYIKGISGNGPDGKGAIRLDTTTAANSCFRNEVSLTGDASIYFDNDQPAGFGGDCPLNLNGHTLTINGQGTTLFNCPAKAQKTCIVTPGKGGKVVINTPKNPEIRHDVKFLGDASNVLTISKASSLFVSSSATFPWTIVADNIEPRVETGVSTLSSGVRYLLGGNTRHEYSATVNLGSTGQSGSGASLVVCSGAVFSCATPAGSSPEQISSIEEGPIPALYKIEAGAFVTNKSISTYGGTLVRKLATQNWGDYVQVGSAYLANWNGCGFFGLEGGRLYPRYSGYLLGMSSSRGLLQQDGGIFEFDKAMNISKSGRSDYLMRGGKISQTSGTSQTLYLTREDDAGYPRVDGADDFVSFSMVGSGSPLAEIDGVFNLNCRTGIETSVNLDAGRLSLKTFSLGGATTNFLSYLNFNGGTLVMPTNAWEYLATHNMTPAMTTIYGKGATFELDRTNRTFLTSQKLNAECSFPLRGAQGRGIKSVTLPSDMPRTGYRGIMPTRIVRADGDSTGNGAQAALDFNVAAGTVADQMIILCPGSDYTVAPKIYAYGPDFVTAYACTVELTDTDQVPGSFVKTGVGELVMNTKDNTYAGPYIISNGTLMVNYNAVIPTSAEVFVAGGCFRWDWRSRTIAKFGGWGTFFGSRNDSTEKLTVTTTFTVDADDLNAGRLLAVDQNENEDGNGKYAKNDAIAFGSGCRVAVRNADRLDEETEVFVLLRQETAINLLPSLETDLPKFKLIRRKNNTELCLRRRSGLTVFVH